MKLPRRPPRDWEVIETVGADAFVKALNDPAIQRLRDEANAKYLHWDRFRHYPMPEGTSPELAWAIVAGSRIPSFRSLPLSFKTLGTELKFWTPPHISSLLHRIDLRGGGTLGDDLPDPDEKERYLVNSLMEEAIASSQLEGAATTREVAKKMLRSNRKPRTRHEQMILNNYNAILEIRERKNDPLTPELLCHFQRIITEKTLDDDGAAGRFRTAEESVNVIDTLTGDILHEPPPASEIAVRLREVCDLANEQPYERDFIHPVVIGIALHFAIGFIHPFVDGNGRTARALFYWHMLRNSYWLFEFLPISRAVLESPVRYGRAYLYTETDRGDLTYFVHYNLKVVELAIRRTHEYVRRQQALIRRAEQVFATIPELSHRQLEVAYDAVRDPARTFTVQNHAGKFGVSLNTARKDLEGLEQHGLLRKIEQGRQHVFVPAEHLKKRIMKGTPTQREHRIPEEEWDDPMEVNVSSKPHPPRPHSPLPGQQKLFKPNEEN